MSLSPRTYEALIVLLALAAIGLTGLLAIRRGRARTAVDYFLAGRSTGWLSLGASLFVTTMFALWCVGLALPALPGSAAWVGIGLAAAAGLILLGFAFAPACRIAGSITAPGFLNDRLGGRTGPLIAVATILFALVVRIPLVIFLGSHLLSSLAGWDPLAGALLMIVMPGLLAVAGGYPAIAATQTASAIVGGVGLLVLGLWKSPASPLALQPLTGGDGAAMPLEILGLLILGFWYFSADQFVVQRPLAARSPADLRRGSAAAAAFLVLGVLLLAFGAGSPTQAAGARETGLASGLIGAAILSFVMATLSGHFLSVSTLFTMDVFRTFSRSHDDTTLVLVGRLVTTIEVIFAILAASTVALVDISSLSWIIQAFVAMAPPMAAVSLVSRFWRRMHGRGALWALAAGWVLGALHMGSLLADGQGIVNMMAFAVLSFLMTTVVFVGVSLTAAPIRLSDARAPLLQKGWEVRKP